jgi:hypothetical protein
MRVPSAFVVEHSHLQSDLAGRQGRTYLVAQLAYLVAELGSLGLKVTGDADVEPAMDLGGQIKQFDSHSVVLFRVPARGHPMGQVTLRIWRQNQYSTSR